MNNATVVTLGPLKDGISQEVTFEEAFGEHSEFRGRGRARRQKRKLDRIAKKGERKAARQSVRSQQQEARQSRKDTKRSRRVGRKHMDDDAEQPVQPDEKETRDDVVQSQDDTTSSPNDNSPSYDQPQNDGGETDQSSDDTSYDDSDSEDADSDTDESGFDGVLSQEDARQFSAEGSQVHPQVEELTRRIKWNRKLIQKLEAQRTKQNAPAIQQKINDRKSRIILLQDELKDVKAKLGTRIGKGVKAKVSKQKIEVPASNASGPTGLNGLDNMYDYDAPDTRVIEITSSAEGSTAKKINWKPIVIGVAIGAVIIYGLHKAKVFSKK